MRTRELVILGRVLVVRGTELVVLVRILGVRGTELVVLMRRTVVRGAELVAGGGREVVVRGGRDLVVGGRELVVLRRDPLVEEDVLEPVVLPREPLVEDVFEPVERLLVPETLPIISPSDLNIRRVVELPLSVLWVRFFAWLGAVDAGGTARTFFRPTADPVSG